MFLYFKTTLLVCEIAIDILDRSPSLLKIDNGFECSGTMFLSMGKVPFDTVDAIPNPMRICKVPIFTVKRMIRGTLNDYFAEVRSLGALTPNTTFPMRL